MFDKKQIEKFRGIIENSKRAVFFGGAGVSTQSGIPDFRSQDGLYSQKYAYPPEYMLSATFYRRHTREFFDFYRDKMVYKDAKPNAAHLKIAEWEKRGKLAAVVTQNIDGLHQAAGSRTVLELHGSIHRNVCVGCGTEYPLKKILESTGIPHCGGCGAVVKPSVVLYEEPLDGETMELAVKYISSADTLIIGGTSLAVYPAAGFVDFFRGENLVVVNKAVPAKKLKNALYIDENIAEFFSMV